VFTKNLPIGGRDLDAAAAKQLKVELGEARLQRLQLADVGRIATPQPVAAVAAEPKPAESGFALLAAGLRKSDTKGTATMEDRRQGQPAPGLSADVTQHTRHEFHGPRINLGETVEMLTDEIAGCLRYHEAVFPERRVNRAIFMGGESRHLGLAQHIARTLRLPAQVADPMAGVGRTGKEATPGVDFRQPQPGWAMVLGLSMSPTDL